MNSTHPIADDYSIDLTELRNGQSVDSRILTDLQEMFDAASRPIFLSGFSVSL